MAEFGRYFFWSPPAEYTHSRIFYNQILFMSHKKASFSEHEILHKLKHYLPAQAPLKDFIHHNTLHAFQDKPFHQAVHEASTLFGYRVYLSLEEYRARYQEGKINPDTLRRIIRENKGEALVEEWTNKLLHESYTPDLTPRVGALRQHWKERGRVNLDKEVHPILFRLAGAYLDQGISIWKFPKVQGGFLASIRVLEADASRGIFRSQRVKKLLADEHTTLSNLLQIIVGNPAYFEQYLFDMSFAHPGWSGMVAMVEDKPDSLLARRKISLESFLILELLLEIDTLDRKWGEDWKPLFPRLESLPEPLFDTIPDSELFEVYALFQEALEWTYYDEVLQGIQKGFGAEQVKSENTQGFQAMFCIDDRECSLRRQIEALAPDSQTYGTAGFFNVAFYFQPEHGKFYTKVCPAPVTPKHLIKESESSVRHETDAHFHRHSSGIVGGWIISQTLGFWSAIKMAIGIFRPAESPAMVSSFKHMDPQGKLSIECDSEHPTEGSLQVGYTLPEMVDRMEGLLKSIGLTTDFAPLVYIIGHGASSVNNTHYAGYDCGACSGRAGSVNGRVAAAMLNRDDLRALLKERGISIPNHTQFVGGLHDTTRDEMEYYDLDILTKENLVHHLSHVHVFDKALDNNAKERSRRFLLTDSNKEAEQVHKSIKLRALSLFEPRPEWNHATNSLCLVGRRAANRHLFLDRRAFLNSYDYQVDPKGEWLLGILNAVAPVCGGINLEYYFSRVENYRLGAGSKLPHNVVGLIGVANGMDGDLRPGLPLQMINIHEPLRLMVTVEHHPDIVLETIKKNPATYEWFENEWVALVVNDPDSGQLFRFKKGAFEPYHPFGHVPAVMDDMIEVFENEEENLPVYILSA